MKVASWKTVVLDRNRKFGRLKFGGGVNGYLWVVVLYMIIFFLVSEIWWLSYTVHVLLFVVAVTFFFFMNETKETKEKQHSFLAGVKHVCPSLISVYWKATFRHTFVGELSWSYPRWNNFRSLGIEGWRKLLIAGAPWDAQVKLEVLAVFLDLLIRLEHSVQCIKPQIKTSFGATLC